MAEDIGVSSGEEADIEEDKDEEQEDGKKQGVAGMADVISKILNKKIVNEEKGVVLSKYKEGKKRKLEKEEETQQKSVRAKAKMEFREMNHVIPDRGNAEREVTLRRIGTKGVVKLFNAVTKHQKEMDSKLKKAGTEGKKDKVLDSVSKSSFLDMLKTDAGSKKIREETKTEKNIEENVAEDDGKTPSWNILRDDFMMGSKMKDWDKDDEESDDDEDEAADLSSEDNSDEES